MNNIDHILIVEKVAYIRSASGISVSDEAAKGGLKGGLLFTPYGLHSAGGLAVKNLRGRRKAFAVPVAIGAGLGALSSGSRAMGNKEIMKVRGREGIKTVNLRAKENELASAAETKGLVTGMTGGAAGGALFGKLLNLTKRFKKFTPLKGAVLGGTLFGLGGASLRAQKARKEFQLANVGN